MRHSRSLFVNNLPVPISSSDLRIIFGVVGGPGFVDILILVNGLTVNIDKPSACFKTEWDANQDVLN